MNISWSHSALSSLSLAGIYYFLTISHGSSSHIIPLNESNYYFTALEDAPPCEVYNFSVTAHYVSATYIGAGCNVPSAVLSTMLPSLPDVTYMSDTFSYHLVKMSQGLTLSIYFEVSYKILFLILPNIHDRWL